jgi:hypothetical protein
MYEHFRTSCAIAFDKHQHQMQAGKGFENVTVKFQHMG